MLLITEFAPSHIVQSDTIRAKLFAWHYIISYDDNLSGLFLTVYSNHFELWKWCHKTSFNFNDNEILIYRTYHRSLMAVYNSFQAWMWKPDHNTGNYVPFSCEQCVGSLTSHKVIMNKGCETGPTIYPRRLDSLTICRYYYKGSTISSVGPAGVWTRDLPHGSPVLYLLWKKFCNLLSFRFKQEHNILLFLNLSSNETQWSVRNSKQNTLQTMSALNGKNLCNRCKAGKMRALQKSWLVKGCSWSKKIKTASVKWKINTVTWSFLLFAVCRKRNSKSLYYYIINVLKLTFSVSMYPARHEIVCLFLVTKEVKPVVGRTRSHNQGRRP